MDKPTNYEELRETKDGYHPSTKGNFFSYLVAGFILPASLGYTKYHQLKNKLHTIDESLEGHKKRVERVKEDVKAWNKLDPETRKPMRTNRDGNASHSVRTTSKDAAHQVRLHDLSAILGVDEEKMTIKIEPGVTVGQITKYLTNMGYQLEATLEMEDATLGGLVMATGMTTHSHVCGLTNDTVVAFDIVTSYGEDIHVTAENDHSDLFRALPWSHGTLGFLVGLELKISVAPEYVRMKYTPLYSQQAYNSKYLEVLNSESSPFFLEMIIFSKDLAVLMEGELITTKNYVAETAENKEIRTNKAGAPTTEWFFKYVEKVLDRDSPLIEYIPVYDYLMRHDRSMCMTMGTVIPFGNKAWFRYAMGWMTPPNMVMLKSLRRPEDRENSIRKQVWQDAAFPAETLIGTVQKSHDLFEIYPLLCYPCKVYDNGGMIRIRDENGNKVPYDGTKRSKMFLNLGIYGTPKGIREGKQFKTIHAVREWEKHIRDVGGFQHTYCDSFQTKEEFEEMFDHELWYKMRERYDCDGAFKSIYEKTRPEVNIWPWLKEEKTW